MPKSDGTLKNDGTLTREQMWDVVREAQLGTKDKSLEAIYRVFLCGSQKVAAKSLGISDSAMSQRLRTGYKRFPNARPIVKGDRTRSRKHKDDRDRVGPGRHRRPSNAEMADPNWKKRYGQYDPLIQSPILGPGGDGYQEK